MWNYDFVAFMPGMGFLQCTTDKCLFFHPTLFFLVVLYVDDLGKPTNSLGVKIKYVPSE